MSEVKGTLHINEFIAQFKAEAEAELMALAQQLTGLIQKNAPVGGMGHLSGSFEGKTIDVPNGVGVEVGSPYEYGVYVEWGTRPHWAPITPIMQWVEQKLQPHVVAVGVSFESGRALPTRKGTKTLKGDKRAQAISRLAHAIQYKIAQKGTEAQLFMKRALDQMGLTYTVDVAEGIYTIDVASWLTPRIPDIIARSTRGLE